MRQRSLVIPKDDNLIQVQLQLHLKCLSTPYQWLLCQWQTLLIILTQHEKYTVDNHPLYNRKKKDLPSDFVLQLLAWDDCNVITNPLVCVEVKSKTWIIFLDYDPGGLFHRLRSNTTLQKLRE